MADDEGVRRRDVLKGLGVTGAVAGIVATAAPSAVQEAQAQPAAQPHARAAARDGQAGDAFRFFTPPEAAVSGRADRYLDPKGRGRSRRC